jgi:hypothetical protein
MNRRRKAKPKRVAATRYKAQVEDILLDHAQEA